LQLATGRYWRGVSTTDLDLARSQNLLQAAITGVHLVAPVLQAAPEHAENAAASDDENDDVLSDDDVQAAPEVEENAAAIIGNDAALSDDEELAQYDLLVWCSSC